MARTESNADLALGALCPAFELMDVRTGRAVGRDDLFAGTADADGRVGLLVAFLSVHCPFVQQMEAAFGALAGEFSGQIATAAVMSNDLHSYPQDGPEAMRAQAERLGWNFPYLLDSSQETALEFHAACTPDIFLFDHELRLVYHGQFDGTRPYRASDAAAGIVKDAAMHRDADGGDLRRAVEALIAGEASLAEQRPCLGCNIKWRG